MTIQFVVLVTIDRPISGARVRKHFYTAMQPVRDQARRWAINVLGIHLAFRYRHDLHALVANLGYLPGENLVDDGLTSDPETLKFKRSHYVTKRDQAAGNAAVLLRNATF